MPLARQQPPAPPIAVHELRSVGLFAGLSDDFLAHLAVTLEACSLEASEVAFHECDPGRELFVIADGELEVTKRTPSGRDVILAQLKRNEWFGAMALIDVMPRPVTVRALSPTRLIRVRSTDLDAIYRRDVKAYALIVMNIARQFSRQLRRAEIRLASETEPAVKR